VVIQCHDDPDPDAIASAFALYTFLSEQGRDVQIVYGGFSEIQKTNLLLMAVELKIPLKFIKYDDNSPIFEGNGKNILITVDCQYGIGNVKKFAADEVAIIDHHVKESSVPSLSDIRPFLGSCSTIMWHLLYNAGFDFKNHLDVGTALYYGLYTDTNSLSEIMHPLDKDLRDNIKYDSGLIKKLKNSNLSIGDLTIAANTLNNRRICEKINSAVFEAEPCDPNILGFTSDLALQVDNIDVCIVYCRLNGGLKLSVRSCVREVMANELVERICQGIGSGGGHNSKAGGFISMDMLEEDGAAIPSDFLLERLTQYFAEYDHIYGDRLKMDTNKLAKYRKKAIPIGFVRSIDVFPIGTELLIRTLEGDTHVMADPDIYIMIGIDQGAWPIKRVKFEASYRELDSPYKQDEQFKCENGYEPTVKDRIQSEAKSLLPFVRSCVPTGESIIYAIKLERRTKVFTPWNLEGYMFGGIGDYLEIRSDDIKDAYVIEESIFHKTYTKIS
jgi:phosphoglycolate phosphatase